MNKKILTISIVTLLALAIVAGFLWFTQNGGESKVMQKVGNAKIVSPINTVPPTISPAPTPQKEEIAQNEVDTSDWKTYTNEEYGFSLRYPEGWDVKEDRYQVSKNVIAIAGFVNSKIEDGFLISIGTHKKSFIDYMNDLKKEDSERQKRSNELFESNNSFSDNIVNGKNVIFSNGYAGPIGSFYKMYIPYNQGETIIFSGGQKRNLELIYKSLKFQ